MSKVDHINVLRLKEVCYTEGTRLSSCLWVSALLTKAVACRDGP